MTTGASFGFGAERRIASKADYERLLRSGKKRSRAGFTFFTAEKAEGPARLGILISRKHSAKATVRNRIKRCIREAFRHAQSELGTLDLLVRPPFGARPGPAMMVRLQGILMELARR